VVRGADALLDAGCSILDAGYSMLDAGANLFDHRRGSSIEMNIYPGYS